MSGLTMRVLNRAELRQQAELHPFLERVAAIAAPGRVLREVRMEREQDSMPAGWVCFTAGETRGFALQMSGLDPTATRLSQVSSSARLARRVAADLGFGSGAIAWDPAGSPGEDWRVFTLCFDRGSCLCACTGQVVCAPETAARRELAHLRVRVRLFAEAISLEQLVSGEPELIVRLPEIRARGALSINQEGSMCVQIEEDLSSSDERGLVVRLEIGEIELGLQDLLGLKPGSRLELGAQSPLPCALVIGATTIAQGVIESLGTMLRVRITESVQ